ncbi:MAG: class II aldolase/adducin family protein [Candidatus Altiarchaeota archaeon]
MGEEYVGRKFKTEFVQGDGPDPSLAGEIIGVGKRLNELGLTPENAGNISVRVGKGILITVGGVNKGELTGDDVVLVVGFDFHTARVVGLKEPSSEVPMHWSIYEEFPEVNAVVHAHDMKAVENAVMLEREFGFKTTTSREAYGTRQQAMEVVEALRESRYAIIRGHGVVCAGDSLEEALDRVVRVNGRVWGL